MDPGQCLEGVDYQFINTVTFLNISPEKVFKLAQYDDQGRSWDETTDYRPGQEIDQKTHL